MDPTPDVPGFYIRHAIPHEVYHLEIVRYELTEKHYWRWWCPGANHALDVPIEEIRRIAAIGDLVLLLPEES